MKKINRKENLLISRQKAMPEIKRLIKSYGRASIVWCLNQLREYEKKIKQLAELRREANKLEKEIR